MLIGIFVILLAALLNAALVMIPFVIVILFLEFVRGFMNKLKLNNDWLFNGIMTAAWLASLFFAASLQVGLWQLKPEHAPWRWSLAEITFVLGAFVLLMWQVRASDSPYTRAAASYRFMIGTILFTSTLGMSFLNPAVHDVVKHAPARVSRFVFGETAQ